MGDAFFRTCRFGVMTYVLMHALTSMTAFVLTTFTDIYEEGQNPPPVIIKECEECEPLYAPAYSGSPNPAYVLWLTLLIPQPRPCAVVDTAHAGKIHVSAAKGGYAALACINNAVQMWAMYCLIQFYRCAEPQLSQHQPVAKLCCVKAVVFFAWWQLPLTRNIAVSLSLSSLQPHSHSQHCCLALALITTASLSLATLLPHS